MKPDTDNPPRPLIPKLVLGGFLILFLSWLCFMVSYLVREASKPRSASEVRTSKSAATNAPAAPRREGR